MGNRALRKVALLATLQSKRPSICKSLNADGLLRNLNTQTASRENAHLEPPLPTCPLLTLDIRSRITTKQQPIDQRNGAAR